MKLTKKLISVALTLVLVIALAVPTLAASVTITSKENNDHYVAYQIFTGKEYETPDGKKGLTDIKWSSNVTDTAGLITALQGEAKFKPVFDGANDADSVAKALANLNADQTKLFADIINQHLTGTPVVSGEAVKLAEGSYQYEISGLADGYYLIKDAEDSVGPTEAYTDFILQVAGETSVVAKSDVPTVDKKITGEDGNDFKAPETEDDDELSVGDTVKYELSSKVADNAKDYDIYYFVFRDTLSKGLTLDENSIVVKANDEELTKDKYSIKVEDKLNEKGEKDGTLLAVALIDAKNYSGQKITVTYNAELNEFANVGTAGNDNMVHLQFSNNPNHSYNGDTYDRDNDGFPDVENKDVLGETPDKKVQTFTTGIEIRKVDENGDVLTGAGFTITGDNLNVTLTAENTFVSDPNGDYYLLKDGTYTTVAPREADEMVEKINNRNNGYVKTNETDRNGYITVGESGYAPATKAERDSDVTLYTLHKANTEKYESTTEKYRKDVVYKSNSAEKTGDELSIYAEVGADGVARFYGLGSGAYTIEETQVPKGYNSMDPIHVVITWEAPANEASGCTWEIDADHSDKGFKVENGIITVTIENQSGSLLPGTGGIGTTIFYVVGICLVAGAVVLLVVRRRMGNNN